MTPHAHTSHSAALTVREPTATVTIAGRRTHLPPEQIRFLPAMPPPPRARLSDLARELATAGRITLDAAVKTVAESEGTANGRVEFRSPTLAAATQTSGGESIALPLPMDAVCWFNLGRRVRIIVELDEEEDA